MLLPGEYSVIVPLPSVVVVVVVVSETCAHANGVATANAILSISFFITLLDAARSSRIRIQFCVSRWIAEKVAIDDRAKIKRCELSIFAPQVCAFFVLSGALPVVILQDASSG